MEQTQNKRYKVDFAAVNAIDAADVYEYVSGTPYPPNGHIYCPKCGSRDNVSINRRTNHFHCFGCSGDGRGEISAVDYAAAVFKCSPYDAADRLINHFFVKVADGAVVDGDADRLINRAATANTCTKKRLHDATIEQPHRYDEAVDGDACLQKIYGVIGCNILFTIAHNRRYKFMTCLRLYRGNTCTDFKSVRNKTTSK